MITFRIPTEDAEHLKHVAHGHGVTVSEFVRILLGVNTHARLVARHEETAEKVLASFREASKAIRAES